MNSSSDKLKHKRISLEDAVPVIEQVLRSGGEFDLITAGNSMYPTLRHRRDGVSLVLPGRPVVGDILLCRRDDGSFVLHRLVFKLGGKYYIKGDNQQKSETVRYDQIIAKASAILRNGTRIDRHSKEYYKRLVKVKIRQFLRKTDFDLFHEK